MYKTWTIHVCREKWVTYMSAEMDQKVQNLESLDIRLQKLESVLNEKENSLKELKR